MLAHARPVAVTTNRHVLLYRSVGAPVREKCKLVDRHRVQCSPSNGEWHAAADGDWGSNATGTDEEDKRTFAPETQLRACYRILQTVAQMLLVINCPPWWGAHGTIRDAWSWDNWLLVAARSSTINIMLISDCYTELCYLASTCLCRCAAYRPSSGGQPAG